VIDIKWWLTSVQGLATTVSVVAGAVVAVGAAWSMLFARPQPLGRPEVNLRDLTVKFGELYPADLYVLKKPQDLEHFSPGNFPPPERGILAQLEIVADVKGDSPTLGCVLDAFGAPLWRGWPPPEPSPEAEARSRTFGGVSLWDWVSRDEISVGGFQPGSPRYRAISFEIFFREQSYPLTMRLNCEEERGSRLQKEIVGKIVTGKPYVRIKAEFPRDVVDPRYFRIYPRPR
jgi:hypothetical protein